MAWRIVKQPSGLYARFSEVVDNFTDFNMTREQVLERCVEIFTEEARIEQEAAIKVERADTSPTRWEEDLKTLREIHGQRQLDEFLAAVAEDEEGEIVNALNPPVHMQKMSVVKIKLGDLLVMQFVTDETYALLQQFTISGHVNNLRKPLAITPNYPLTITVEPT